MDSGSRKIRWAPRYDPSIVETDISQAGKASGFYWVSKTFRGTGNTNRVCDEGVSGNTKTPVTNPPRYVFLKTQSKKDLCLVLSAPVANEVEFSRLQRNGIPKNIITRSGGNAPSDLRIRYEWNPDKRKYEAIECTQSGIVRKKRIVCESVLEAFK